jgi:hypothetical protein
LSSVNTCSYQSVIFISSDNNAKRDDKHREKK